MTYCWHSLSGIGPVILSELLGKGGVGAKPPLKMGAWSPKAPSLADLLLCLDKVRKVRLG